MTRALDPEVVDAIWAAIEPILPRPDGCHPLGCHNPRVPDKVCFRGSDPSRDWLVVGRSKRS